MLNPAWSSSSCLCHLEIHVCVGVLEGSSLREFKILAFPDGQEWHLTVNTESVVNSTDCGFPMSPWSSSSHLSPTIEFFVSPLPNQKMTGHSFRLKFLWKERKWNMWVRLGTGEQQRHLAYSATDFRRLRNVLAAAAKSLQSCPTLCNPIDGRPSGSSVPGILQARILEWVAISFSSGR